MRKVTSLAALVLLLTITVGCSSVTSQDAERTPKPTPTTFQFFTNSNQVSTLTPVTEGTPASIPTVASLFIKRDTPTPKPTATPQPTSLPRQPQSNVPDASANLISHYVFDDDLNSEWEILESVGAIVDTTNQNRAYEGTRSIAFTPEVDFSTLFFAVKETSNLTYLSEDVFGISFWINGGDDFIQLDQLALSVIGSNEYTYWSPDDDSVEFADGDYFSETRLYFLGLNRSVPPNTWVEVFLQIDTTLIYDPVYKYVVGFYLKNDLGFRNTVYIDDVRLLLVNEPIETEVIATPSPIPTAPTLLATVETDAEATPTAILSITPSPEANATTTAPAETEACVVSPPAGWELYTIQSGDSISNLAYERGEAAEVVLDVNCFEPGVILSLNQEVWLPPLLPVETPEP